MVRVSRRFLTRWLSACIGILPESLLATEVEMPKSGDQEGAPLQEIFVAASGYDDTRTINQALAVAGQAHLRFGPGIFYYNGGERANFSGSKFAISGSGSGSSVIQLGENNYFLYTERPVGSCLFEGLTIRGGRGAFFSDFRGVNVTGKKVFQNNRFEDYRECAIQNNGHDEPYWLIDANVFSAANSTHTIGVALSRFCDNSLITRNSFLKNRVHLKLRSAGVSCMVHDNDFLFFDRGDPLYPRSSIWLVLHESRVNAGVGFVASHNKFGNEGQSPEDCRILFASEVSSSGACNGALSPDLANSVLGYADGHIFLSNKVSGGPAVPFLYSTTPNLRSIKICLNSFDGTPPSEIIKFKEAPRPDPFNQTNLVALNTFGAHGVNSPAPLVSEAQGIATVLDPNGIFETDPRFCHGWLGGGDATGSSIVLDSAADGFAIANGVDSTSQHSSVPDALGQNDASCVQPGSGWRVILSKDAPEIRLGDPAWIEFDLTRYGVICADVIDAALFSDGDVCWQRVLRVPANGWRRFRFLFVFGSPVNQIRLSFANRDGGGQGGFAVGRVKIYHSREPMNFSDQRAEDISFSNLPTSPERLPPGRIWVDETNGNILRRK